MFEYVLFDLDGTLTDSSEGIINAAIYALEKLNIEVNERDELRKFIGPPLQDSFSEDYGFSKDETQEAIDYFREYYNEKGLLENRPYDNIEQVLIQLKLSEKKLVVATSKPEVFTNRILEHFKLLNNFYFVAGATLDSTRIKKKDIIAYALEALKVEDKSKVVMIGDRKHDISGAAANGIASIGVLWGFGDEAELEQAGATYLAKEVTDLLKIID